MVLTRLDANDNGTFGRIEVLGKVFFTCERPWKNNEPGVSCIPTGRYDVVWSYSPRFRRETYLVRDVAGRSGIRIHPANLPLQLLGCIALGEQLGQLDGEKAVLRSQSAVRNFEQLLEHKPFTLEIT